jgi:serine/threonine protein phosphatase PrpC
VTTEGGHNRVNGRLGVTRSFGDTRFSCVNADPDIRELNLTGSELCIIMACDGLWDVLDERSVGILLKSHTAKGEKLSTLSEMLVNEALRLGSTDNVSVVIIDLVDIN